MKNEKALHIQPSHCEFHPKRPLITFRSFDEFGQQVE